MYKVTVEGKTMVGCNQDAWRTTTCIWFENSKDTSGYGACFTGSRKVGPNKFAPQSGMNEKGLVFSRLTAYHPLKNIASTGKKQVPNEVQYLSDILHNCKTVEEVADYINMFDHSVFINDVFIYIDKSGRYLIVEPYKLIQGNDPTYVLSNFCPSLTSRDASRKLFRFKHGEDYLNNNQLSTSLDFCRSVSDTMSVCRDRNGDGTLLTSIWDTQKGIVNLYFYHSFDSTIQFNINDELALGDHIISIPEQFPENLEFQRLISYKTPFNVNALKIVLALIGGILFLLSLLFIVSYFRNKSTHRFNLIKIPFALLNMILFAYLFILATNINIYYFDAPYQDPVCELISLSSYVPFLVLGVFLPIIFFNVRFIKSNSKAYWSNGMLITNSLIYVILLVAFEYWGLYDVFN